MSVPWQELKLVENTIFSQIINYIIKKRILPDCKWVSFIFVFMRVLLIKNSGLWAKRIKEIESV